MELVDGATLADHLTDGPLDWRIAVRVCAEVSAALTAANVSHSLREGAIRLSPHFYNTREEIRRALSIIERALSS